MWLCLDLFDSVVDVLLNHTMKAAEWEEEEESLMFLLAKNFSSSLWLAGSVSRESLRALYVFVSEWKHKQSSQASLLQGVLQSAEDRTEVVWSAVLQQRVISNSTVAVCKTVNLPDYCQSAAAWSAAVTLQVPVMFSKAEWIPHYGSTAQQSQKKEIEVNEGAAVSLWERVGEINPFSGVLEQNQEVKKPAQFMLQRVEKESWQQDKSGGKSGEKNWREKKSPQLKTRKVSFVVESL